MTTETTVEVHHLLEGPEDAPMLVMANSSFACCATATKARPPRACRRCRLLDAKVRSTVHSTAEPRAVVT
jgi:hypothetical protein